MVTNRKFQDTIKFKTDNVEFRLTLISFKEAGSSILYSPALDLSGYGDNEGEALNSFNETLSLYLEYVMNEKTIEKDLERLGWSKNQFFKKQFKTTKYNPKDVMSKRGVSNYGIHDIASQLALQL